MFFRREFGAVAALSVLAYAAPAPAPMQRRGNTLQYIVNREPTNLAQTSPLPSWTTSTSSPNTVQQLTAPQTSSPPARL